MDQVPRDPRRSNQTISNAITQIQLPQNDGRYMKLRNGSQSGILKSPTDIQSIFHMAQSNSPRRRHMAMDAAKNLGTLSKKQSLHLAMLLGRNSSKHAWEWLIASLTPEHIADSIYMEHIIKKYFAKSEIAILNLGLKLRD